MNSLKHRITDFNPLDRITYEEAYFQVGVRKGRHCPQVEHAF